MQKRALEGRAIIAGEIVNSPLAPPPPGMMVSALVAQQVFIRIPEYKGPCPELGIACNEPGNVATYTRDENRCLMPKTCAPWGACPAIVPSCGAGYQLVQWLAGEGHACPAYACDPEWARSLTHAGRIEARGHSSAGLFSSGTFQLAR